MGCTPLSTFSRLPSLTGTSVRPQLYLPMPWGRELLEASRTRKKNHTTRSRSEKSAEKDHGNAGWKLLPLRSAEGGCVAIWLATRSGSGNTEVAREYLKGYINLKSVCTKDYSLVKAEGKKIMENQSSSESQHKDFEVSMGVQNGSRRHLPVLCINSNEIEKLW